MIKILSLTTLILLASPTLAADWREIGTDTTDIKSEIDVTRILKIGQNNASYWVRMSGGKLNDSGVARIEQNIISNCATDNRAYKISYIYGFDGKILEKEDNATLHFKPIVTGSTGGELHWYACTKAGMKTRAQMDSHTNNSTIPRYYSDHPAANPY